MLWKQVVQQEYLKPSILIVNKTFIYSDNACGVDLGYENFPFIYFVTPDKDHLFRTLCVEKCPVIKFKPDDSKYLNSYS